MLFVPHIDKCLYSRKKYITYSAKCIDIFHKAVLIEEKLCHFELRSLLLNWFSLRKMVPKLF